MTLVNNTLSVEFKNRFAIQEASLKTIYGFLCLDSHVLNFFNKNQDISIGYMFADLLSLYLINKLIYTTHSSTYKKALTVISKNK